MKIIVLLIIGALLGAGFTFFGKPLLQGLDDMTGGETTEENQPLYWVAPMDPNFRRDGPGKSPMGMDLIPVYAEDESGDAGGVEIPGHVQQQIGVRTEAVEPRVPSQAIRSLGIIRYDEHEIVHIHPRVTGWIEELFVRAEGDPVKRNDPVYQIYSPELVSAQEELVLALNRQNRNLISAAEQRLRNLSFPAALIEALKRDRRVRQSVIFRAPRDGIVQMLSVREGFYVTPSVEILSIAGLDTVWVEVLVSSEEAKRLRPGLPVLVSVDGFPERQWEGQIDYLEPEIDPRTRSLRARVILDNADRVLRPGLYARIQVSGDAGEAVATVPAESLIRTGRMDRVVMRREDGSFKSVEVTVGQYFDGYYEILAGLETGDTIVTSAQFLIDSESSKSSDFLRMSPIDGAMASMAMSGDGAGNDQNDEPVWVGATVEEVIDDHRMTLAHGEIEAWNMMGMVMDFQVQADIDISHLQPGDEIHVQVRKDPDYYFMVTEIHGPMNREAH